MRRCLAFCSHRTELRQNLDPFPRWPARRLRWLCTQIIWAWEGRGREKAKQRGEALQNDSHGSLCPMTLLWRSISKDVSSSLLLPRASGPTVIARLSLFGWRLAAMAAIRLGLPTMLISRVAL